MMGLNLSDGPGQAPLRKTNVFLAASIPNPSRWPGYFDAREITDAVVAAARAVLTAGGTLVTGAHPTISPLLLYVAAELPKDVDGPRVVVYQSALFGNSMPAETRRFETEGVGRLCRTDAAPGDRPEYPHWHESLRIMRDRMFAETHPRAGIFIGGMQDISVECALLRALRPEPVIYALARPGGEAAKLMEYTPPSLQRTLTEDDVYPSVFRKVISDLARREDADQPGSP